MFHNNFGPAGFVATAHRNDHYVLLMKTSLYSRSLSNSVPGISLRLSLMVYPVSGFEQLGSVRNFEITNSSGLARFSGVSSLNTIRGDLYSTNLDLEKASGCAALTSASIAGSINVSTNISWDCQQFPPTFVPVNVSTNCLRNCTLQ